MKKQFAMLMGASVLALLGACGGGSDATGDDPADKYVGSWSVCRQVSANQSIRESTSFTKTTATSGNFSYMEAIYASLNCTGAESNPDSGSGTFTIVGTKTIGDKVVDKFVIKSADGSEFKQVFLVSGGLFYIGLDDEDGGTRDGEGFQNSLEAVGKPKQ